MSDDDVRKANSKQKLIKDNLQRAFRERSQEEIPADLMALVAKLRAQDEENGAR
jgi:hypothetical protein